MCVCIYVKETYGERLRALHTHITHCKTRQRTATHCNTLQHTATHCNTLHTHIIDKENIRDINIYVYIYLHTYI